MELLTMGADVQAALDEIRAMRRPGFATEKNLAKLDHSSYIVLAHPSRFGICSTVRSVGDTCVTKPCTEHEQHKTDLWICPHIHLRTRVGEPAISRRGITLHEGQLTV